MWLKNDRIEKLNTAVILKEKERKVPLETVII
jgi:hypothetical protein